jgi:trans-2,3-dihydro-3-hydroxyanthranilate isomerase
MRELPYTLVDVFTDEPLAGNPLAVVHDADGLGDDVMLAFARETRLSETTFVQTAGAAGATYRNRIWTMSGELPFAGHPSLGTAVAEALRRGDRDVTYRQQTPAGVQPVRVAVGDDGRAEASVLQEPAQLAGSPPARAVMLALGLAADSGDPDLEPCLVSTGLPVLVVPLRGQGRLAEVRRDPRRLRRVAGAATMIYPFWFDREAGRAHARGLSHGPEEDPATGSAAGALMAYLHDRLGMTELEIHQGAHIDRPSVLRASVEDGRVRVGGGVVLVANGVVRLPGR